MKYAEDYPSRQVVSCPAGTSITGTGWRETALLVITSFIILGAKKYLNEALKAGGNTWSLVEMKSVEGDAVITQRKGRVMAVYDLNIAASIKCQEKSYDLAFEICSETCGDIEVSLFTLKNADDL
jgi:Activator of Hsp90 ATPase, N-terminal